MSLSKKNIIGQIFYRGYIDDFGATYKRFVSKKYAYTLKVMSGEFVNPFLMLTVESVKGRSSSDMITEPFLNVKDILKLMRNLKNEIK